MKYLRLSVVLIKIYRNSVFNSVTSKYIEATFNAKSEATVTYAALKCRPDVP